MANKHVKRNSFTLFSREVQMKVKIAYTYTGVHPQKAKRKKDFL